MIEKIYFALTWVSIGTTLGLGACFLLIKSPDTLALRNYRIARIAIACAYISLSLLNIIELLMRSDVVDIELTQSITIVMSSFQAFLFTYTFISLIDLNYVTKKKILLEVLILFILIIFLFTALLADPARSYFNIAFYLYIIYYASMLVRYTFLFIRKYRSYTEQLDNFFTEQEQARFRWIYYSFFAALVVGIGALILTFSTNVLHYILLTVVFICFYAYFGINFIAYAFRFYFVESVLSVGAEPESVLPDDKSSENQLKYAILDWMQTEKYLQPGLTIEQLARELATNRTYLSNYINSVEKKNFREWINSLRIEKAKEMLLSYPHQSIGEIANAVGYNDSSNFNKQFVKKTGCTPQNWRIENS
ncbi:helix-turn-helix domain-containing protein [Paludibacteraceae bacterium OttesenSCG-928-F17]|nr:helix-turn-helix domain-containing protein [Paludibacteraceae bacterium OttesenSCG-928-F17]